MHPSGHSKRTQPPSGSGRPTYREYSCSSAVEGRYTEMGTLAARKIVVQRQTDATIHCGTERSNRQAGVGTILEERYCLRSEHRRHLWFCRPQGFDYDRLQSFESVEVGLFSPDIQ